MKSSEMLAAMRSLTTGANMAELMQMFGWKQDRSRSFRRLMNAGEVLLVVEKHVARYCVPEHKAETLALSQRISAERAAVRKENRRLYDVARGKARRKAMREARQPRLAAERAAREAKLKAIQDEIDRPIVQRWLRADEYRAIPKTAPASVFELGGFA